MRDVVQATDSPVKMTRGISLVCWRPTKCNSVSTEAAEFALCVRGCVFLCMRVCLCMLYVYTTAQCTLINT